MQWKLGLRRSSRYNGIRFLKRKKSYRTKGKQTEIKQQEGSNYKMLKGHAKIELTDVTTGQTHVQEDDNMFTQAIYENLNNVWTQLIGGTKTVNDWHLPLETNMLGGIALFADTIPEDEKQTYFPEGNEVLGYAGTIASDNSSKFWGSRNLLESAAYDPETKTVKFVWDFGTSQGNGTIKCIGMTDGNQMDYYGQSAWNKRYSRYLNANEFFRDFGIYIAEWDDEIITWMENGIGTVTINKSKINLENITLINKLGSIELISKTVVQLPLTSYNYGSGEYIYWKDGDDGYWYGFVNCYNGGNVTIGATQILQIIRINKETYEMEYHNVNIPTYYIDKKKANPIITKNYIISDISRTSSYSDSKYIQRDKIVLISKTDWTVEIKDIKDILGNDVLMLGNVSNSSGTIYEGYGLLDRFSHNLKLPNGLYQMNDLLFNDNGIVVEQTKLPISDASNEPITNGYTGNVRSSLCTPQLGLVGGIHYMIYNKKKRLVLEMDIDRQYSSNKYIAFIRPFDCQKLITINNLSEPVTKTATQTMKITYTITEAD